MSAHRVTVTAAGPAEWLAVLDALDREPRRWTLPPGTRVVVGGASAPPSLVRRSDAHGVRVVQPRAAAPITAIPIQELEQFMVPSLSAI
jgi:hypothetical protein